MGKLHPTFGPPEMKPRDCIAARECHCSVAMKLLGAYSPQCVKHRVIVNREEKALREHMKKLH